MSNKVDNKDKNENKNDINLLYKKIDELNMDNININKDSKRKVKINVVGEDKLIHMIDLEYKKAKKQKKDLLLIIPKQKLIEINYKGGFIKIQINGEIEKCIRELEMHLKKLIHENSELLFNGRKFTMEKINRGLVSNIKNLKPINKKDIDIRFIKTISLCIDKNTKLYEIDKSGKRIEINNFNYKKWQSDDIYGDVYCKCVIKIENLQFVDNIFTYNLVTDLCEIEKIYNYSYVIKNGELQMGDLESHEEDDKLEDEYWDSMSI